MRLINIAKKEILNKFLVEQNHSEFLQSWEWGELAAKEGADVTRIGIEDDNEIVAVATLLKKKVFGFNYLFCPRGPIEAEIKKYKVESYLFEEIRKLTKCEKNIFLRFEPKLKIKNSKFKIERSINIEPSKTVIIDLQKSEEELLHVMHQKTRYNIRLAEKRGVRIRDGNNKDFESFWNIMEETVNRDGFRLHSQDHYKMMLQLDKNFIKLFLAEYNNKILAAVLATFFGDTITYVHGASSNEHRNVMAPYLLHWHIMKLGKSLNYKYYDLNGIDENKWPGVTRFKMGFGGEAVEYPGTFDLIFNAKRYNVYKVLRKFRRMF